MDKFLKINHRIVAHFTEDLDYININVIMYYINVQLKFYPLLTHGNILYGKNFSFFLSRLKCFFVFGLKNML